MIFGVKINYNTYLFEMMLLDNEQARPKVSCTIDFLDDEWVIEVTQENVVILRTDLNDYILRPNMTWGKFAHRFGVLIGDVLDNQGNLINDGRVLPNTFIFDDLVRAPFISSISTH